MLGGQMPIILLKEGTEREKGRNAQMNNIAAAKAVAEAVRSTLGPKGMDKMLVDSLGDVTITNDGATILKELDIEHPAAKMVVEISKTQDQECGDGTTTAVVLAGELLKKAEELLEQNVHPTIITNGFRMASEKALEIIDEIGFDVKENNDELLKELAATAMTGKNVGSAKEKLTEIAVKAVKSVADESDGKVKVDVDNIKVEKKHGGSVEDTELIEGVIIDKERVHPRMPTSVKNAKIALIDAPLEIKKTEIDAKINITDPTQMQAFLDQEERMLKEMVDKIKDTGANVVFCQKGIDDMAQHFLAKDGIFAIRRVKKSDMEKLARATGGNIVANIHDLTENDLGKAGLIEQRKIGDEDMTFVTECKGAKAVSILIRGGTEHVVDEVERALHDALRVVGIALEDGKAVAGGGAPEIQVSLQLKDYAPSVGGREQLAIEAFAQAMEIIPRTLAENAGLDAIDMIIKLRSAHESKKDRGAGIDALTGDIADMRKNKIIEPARVKIQAISSATDVATMILRIDDVIAAKKSSSGGGGGPPGGMGGGGMGGMPGM